MKLKLLLIPFLVTLVGCGSQVESSSESAKVTEEGSANYVEALQQALKENRSAVEPVHFSKLIEALPDAPAGWTADEPEGKTLERGPIKINNCKRGYREEGGDGKVIVEIKDLAFYQILYMAYLQGDRVNEEFPRGFRKAVTVGEWPAIDAYATGARRQLLVHERYEVTIAVDNGTSEDIDTWTKRIKTNKLPAK